jgi:hypothetical protein
MVLFLKLLRRKLKADQTIYKKVKCSLYFLNINI